MTPKEAAEQIVDKYFKEVLHYEVEYGHKLAQACAILHCQGIIEVLRKKDTALTYLEKEIQYWEQVLNEINKL
jgi:stalled ribosome rescue protein Dom34